MHPLVNTVNYDNHLRHKLTIIKRTRFLTNFCSSRSDAIIQSQVRHLTVVCVDVQVCDAHADRLSGGYADLPLTHGVRRIGQRVAQRCQASTTHTQHCVSTAVPFNTSTKPQSLHMTFLAKINNNSNRYFEINHGSRTM